MPEEFDQTVLDAYDSLAGEDAGTPVVPQEPATTDSGTPADTAPATGEGTAEESDQPFRWDNLPDPVVPLAKQLQADYTRKMQEIAEQRKAFEQQQQQIAGWNYLQQLMQQDPAQAAALLQQYAAQLTGGVQAAQSETDPLGSAEPVTEVERIALAELRELRQWRQQQEQFYQQQRAREGESVMNAQYAQIEAATGRTLSEGDKEQLAAYCLQNGLKSLVTAYRDMHFDAEVARAKQLGRDEASTVVQQKAASVGAPSALVSRTPTNAPAEFKNDREMIAHYLDEQLAGT